MPQIRLGNLSTRVITIANDWGDPPKLIGFVEGFRHMVNERPRKPLDQ